MSATSNVNFYPTGNYVLVKMESTISILGLASKKYENEKSKPTLTIAGIGPKVDGLKVGEKVFIPMDKTFPAVPVEGNDFDPEILHEYYKNMQIKNPKEFSKLIKNADTANVTIVLYGIFTDFQIQGRIL